MYRLIWMNITLFLCWQYGMLLILYDVNIIVKNIQNYDNLLRKYFLKDNEAKLSTQTSKKVMILYL